MVAQALAPRMTAPAAAGEMPLPRRQGAVSVVLRGLSKTFESGVVALQPVDLSIAGGEFLLGWQNFELGGLKVVPYAIPVVVCLVLMMVANVKSR